MDKFNHVLDLMDEIIEREIEIEHVFDITKAELSALCAIADAARDVVLFTNTFYRYEAGRRLADALDALDVEV